MKNKKLAFDTLREAYETASPNDIVTPFVELGKDMRTLTMAALREDTGIPATWLEAVRHKALYYAQNQSMFISEYLENTGGSRMLSAREREILSDLYEGLSQSKIAAKRNLSVNTVKMIVKSLYGKLNVHKISDLVRISAERKLV